MSKSALFNKYELFHTVLNSDLKAANKPLLMDLILLANETGDSWPSVQRLCRARGIRNEKNFKGVEYYLPGLVTVTKRGRRNYYGLNIPAIEALPVQDVDIRHTEWPIPAVTTDDPAPADNDPAHEADCPSSAGANSTEHITRDSTKESTETSLKGEDVSHRVNDRPPSAAVAHAVSPLDSKLPVPGDIRNSNTHDGSKALEANDSVEDIAGVNGTDQGQEAATEAPTARLEEVLLIREIEKWTRCEEQRTRVLEKSRELQAAGFKGGRQDLAWAAVEADIGW